MKYPGWLSEAECHFLTENAKASKYNRILEIGCLYGKSSMCILEGLKAAHGDNYHLTVVDPWLYLDSRREHPGAIFWKEMHKAGHDRHITHYKDLSSKVLPLLSGCSFDFVFIDGDHDAMPTLFDCVMAGLYTRKILVHDYNSQSHREVNEAVDAFVQLSAFQPTGTGGTIVRLEADHYIDAPVYGDKVVPE